jgi:hypothetical protein
VIQHIKIDKATTITVANRGAGQVHVAVAVLFGTHSINVTHEQAQALADALQIAAELCRKAVKS